MPHSDSIDRSPPDRGGWIKAVLVGIPVAAMVYFLVADVLMTDDPGGLSPGGTLDREFRYDAPVAAYTPIGRELTPPIYLVQLKTPRGIDVGPDDTLYAVGDKAISIMRPGDHGGQARLIVLGEEPYAIDVADDGTMYVAMVDHVTVLDPAGQVTAAWAPAGKKARFTSLAVTADDVFVADAGHKLVWRYDRATGKVRNTIGQKPVDAGPDTPQDVYLNVPGFILPSPYFDVVVPSDGLVRVADTGRQRVEAYDKDGYYEEPLQWGHGGTAVDAFVGCCNPAHLALLPNDHYVTAEKGLPRIKIYAPMGRFRGVVAGPDELGEEMTNLDLAVDSVGRIYVLDATENVVRVFEIPATQTAPTTDQPDLQAPGNHAPSV